MPVQMKGVITPVATEAESFADGKETGLAWDAPWTPGGPWVPRGLTFNEDHKAWQDAMLANNRAWQRGFEAGRKEVA